MSLSLLTNIRIWLQKRDGTRPPEIAVEVRAGGLEGLLEKERGPGQKITSFCFVFSTVLFSSSHYFLIIPLLF